MHHQITPGAVVLTADQIELTVRALEGNVAALQAADGSWYGYRHVSSLTLVCPPLPPTAPAQSLAAAAGAGQGAGIHLSALMSCIGTAASGIASDGTRTQRKPGGASRDGVAIAPSGRCVGYLMVLKAAVMPFLIAAYSTQYVSINPAIAAASGNSNPKASNPIFIPPQRGTW